MAMNRKVSENRWVGAMTSSCFLGLGSNRGDRLLHLRKALAAIKCLPNLKVKQVSPVYQSDALLPDQAPSAWNQPYLNAAIRCETTQDPHQLLAAIKIIEAVLGREQQGKRWGPRVIDIDILAYGDYVINSNKLTLPHENLQERPFALWPLADVAPLWVFPQPGASYGKTAAELCEIWGSRFSGLAPLRTRQIQQRIDTPQLVGILNTTPDSFSDGGKYTSAEKALTHIINLVAAGADVIDIGAESTAPNAPLLSHDTEWQRLEPIFRALYSAKSNFLIWPKISLDTRHYQTVEKALSFGIDWLNDVSGLSDPNMRAVVANASHLDCVVMHHLSIPADKQQIIPRHLDPVPIILSWAEMHLDELEHQGIHRDRIIFDPGIGFGKAAEHSLCLIKNAYAFSALNTRLLIGHSRKSFLSWLSAYPAEERDVETLSITLDLAKQSIDYLRVHNVDMCARGLKTLMACQPD